MTLLLLGYPSEAPGSEKEIELWGFCWIVGQQAGLFNNYSINQAWKSSPGCLLHKGKLFNIFRAVVKTKKDKRIIMPCHIITASCWMSWKRDMKREELQLCRRLFLVHGSNSL